MIEGQLGFVVASYLAAGATIFGLVAWVGVGHRLRLRRLAKLERDLGITGDTHDG